MAADRDFSDVLAQREECSGYRRYRFLIEQAHDLKYFKIERASYTMNLITHPVTDSVQWHWVVFPGYNQHLAVGRP